MILKEKEFRTALQAVDWTQYNDKILAITCTADAIIPSWAYMLVAVQAEPFAKDVILGDRETALREAFLNNLRAIDTNQLAEKEEVVTARADFPVVGLVFPKTARRLRPG